MEEKTINSKKQNAVIQKSSCSMRCGLISLIQERKPGRSRKWEQLLGEKIKIQTGDGAIKQLYPF